jgi:hypothetical protein
MRVPKSNPSTAMRMMWINDIFSGKEDRVKITIGDNCKISINDLRHVKEDSDGTKLKEKVTDPKTKVRYEPFGHTSDTLEYLVTKAFNKEFVEWQRGGKIKKRIALKHKDVINY